MLSKLLNKQGRTAVEFMLVMVLLLLFAMAALTLVASGSKAYGKTVERGNQLSELRIAQSYFHTKIRQNNLKGAIHLAQYEGIEGNCLVIDDIEYHSEFQTVIYTLNGSLYEALIPIGNVPDPDVSFEICKLDGFELRDEEGKGIWLTTWIAGEDMRESLESFIALEEDY